MLPSNFSGSEVFAVTTPINTNGGKLSGFEINYQQPFTFLPGNGKNFGALVNYTFVKSKIAYAVSPTSMATITDDLINLSPNSFNATLYYDDGKFSARHSGSYRSGFLQAVPATNNNDVAGKNSTVNVDASMSYKVNKNLEFTLEAINLTNQANDQYISSQRNSSVVNHVTGREYMAGIRYKFCSQCAVAIRSRELAEVMRMGVFALAGKTPTFSSGFTPTGVSGRCKAAPTRASSPVKKQNTYGSLNVVQRIDLPYEILLVVRRFRHGGIHLF